MLAQQESLAILDWLAGKPPARPYQPDDFSEIGAVAWSILDEYEQPTPGEYAAVEDIRQELHQVIPVRFGDPGKVWLADLFGPHPTSFPSLAEIAAGLQPVSWLWPDWLPVGMLSLLAARPGTGKSLVALDLARRIIHGLAWPDDPDSVIHPAPVVYVEGENVPQILNERAESWSMDTRRLYLMLPERGDCLIDLSAPRYQDKLAWMCQTIRPALVIIDSLGSVMDSGENAVEDVRDLMGYLSSVAMSYGLSLLMIHHLRKGSGSQMALVDGIDIDMIRGSGHLAAMARTAWGLSTIQTGPEPDRNGPRRLEVIKTNLGKYPDPLGIAFETFSTPPVIGGSGGPGAGVRLNWTANAPTRYQQPTEGDDCGDWLIEVLTIAGEPMQPKTLIEMGAAAGYSRRMIYRAREELGAQIVNSHGRQHPSNGWALAANDHTLEE